MHHKGRPLCHSALRSQADLNDESSRCKALDRHCVRLKRSVRAVHVSEDSENARCTHTRAKHSLLRRGIMSVAFVVNMRIDRSTQSRAFVAHGLCPSVNGPDRMIATKTEDESDLPYALSI